jgi:guanine nucleotide-binding protein alpha-1 subunit
MTNSSQSPPGWPPPPPPDETEEERIRRTEKDKEAKRVSDLIDLDIAKDKAERKKREAHIKIILLGAQTVCDNTSAF